MAAAEARRAQLKAEIRREIDANSRLLVHTKSSFPKTGSPPTVRSVVPAYPGQFHDPPAAAASQRSSSGKRSGLYIKTFEGSEALSCIRQVPQQSTDRGRSPSNGVERRAASPLSVPYATSTASSPRGSAAQLPVSKADASNGDNATHAGGIRRSFFTHHKNIVFPDPSSPVEVTKLWLNKPLADGTRYASTKRRHQEETPRRSESPSGKRRIAVENHLGGSSVTVAVPTPESVRGRRHVADPNSRTNSPGRPPYHESDAEPSSSHQASQANTGLLGYGPTGKRSFSRPADHPRLLDEDPGVKGPEPIARGVRFVDGRSHCGLNVTALHEYTAEEVNEEKFKPSVVVLHGPPAFVPPPPPQRTQSPRRGVHKFADNDIFNVTPKPVTNSPAPPLRVGRGVGIYSPLRSERPF